MQRNQSSSIEKHDVITSTRCYDNYDINDTSLQDSGETDSNPNAAFFFRLGILARMKPGRGKLQAF